MRSAGEIHGDARPHRESRGVARSSRGTIRAFDEIQRPGETEFALLVARQLAIGEPVDVVRGVNEQQIVSRDSFRAMQMLGVDDTIFEHTIAKERVLRDWKAMARRKRKAVFRA